MEPNAKILLESDTNELEIVEFRIDEVDDKGNVIPCYFGVNVAKVREIIRLPELRKVVNANPCISGMIKLRDQVISLIDLSRALNKNTEGITADRVLVLEFNRVVVGILVHSVSRIYRISWENVEPPVKAIHDANITGVVKMEDRIILILDFEKIIAELSSQMALNMPTAEQLLPQESLNRETKTIIVADDSRFIRATICNTLREAGYKVEEAENGEEAWQLISAKMGACGGNIASNLNLVITDIEMPRMDGLHLTAKIRKETVLDPLPVVIFSSLASQDNKAKWKNLGAADILTKPDLPNLVEKADTLVI
ncbi:chemotaxis protein CheV [Geomesophilobacter sediminis]|uniref:Chemotaxis protein CheV n=1 Tax=Geomesophilobacter sediminis TaxID=2798584 RepID=A0A8J7M0T1_9BACT|nr:chemotaxis protein [Geomesophilobacter sediminis]MBJ6726508.1 chemotaxis protein CheV [Geomesophilobacter sediminis]